MGLRDLEDSCPRMLKKKSVIEYNKTIYYQEKTNMHLSFLLLKDNLLLSLDSIKNCN